MSKKLYDIDGAYAVCRVCGKRIYRFGMGSRGVVSHARKHVREGKAVEARYQSPRCYNGYDVEFYVKEEEGVNE